MKNYNIFKWKGNGYSIFSHGDGYSKDTTSISYYTGFQKGNGKGYMKFYRCGSGDANPTTDFNHNMIV